MKRWAHLLGALLLCCVTFRAAADELVLFVASISPLQSVSSLELRKLYLGIPVVRGELRLRPLRNIADARANAAFLQNVVALSEAGYERWWLAAAMTSGRVRPAEYLSATALQADVARDPAAVGVGWASALESDHRLRIVRVLWRD